MEIDLNIKFTTTILALIFQTDRPYQTMQTQIRLLLQENSDQGLHCLSFQLHLWTNFSMKKHISLYFRVITANILGVQKLGLLQYMYVYEGEAGTHPKDLKTNF